MPSSQSAQQWILAKKPAGPVVLSGPDAAFELRTVELSEPKQDEALVELIYLSLDPAQRGWIDKYADPRRLYRPPVKQGDVVAIVGSICRIVQLGAKSETLKEGDFVSTSAIGWSEYNVVPLKALRKVQQVPGHNLSVHLGALGGSVALTAYFALKDIIELKEGESIIISGAAGGVGSVAVQLAKHVFKAKLVIGTAGTNDKCKWVQEIGADKCINYRDKDWIEQLVSATPDFVNGFLDNVGGRTLTAVLGRMARYGRIAAIGAIDSYNGEARDDQGLPKPEIGNWFNVIAMKLKIQGTIVTDFMDRFPEAFEVLTKAFKQGHLKLEGSETVVKIQFDQIPKTWTGLFEGSNQGKFVAQLKDAKTA